MAQKLKDDKIGALSHGGGAIVLTASPSIPSWLTIGGQQYKVTSSLSRTITTDLTMTANSLYMVYAVRNAGNTELRISANVNSVGPSGFVSWKLVGAFYSNGVTGSIAFGSFVTVDGVPTSSRWAFTPTGGWNTNITYSGLLERNGDTLKFVGYFVLTGAPNAAQQCWNMPTNLVLDTTKTTPNFGAVGTATAQDSGTASYMQLIQILGSLMYPYGTNAIGGTTQTAPFTWGAADSGTVEMELPVSTWNATPLKDL